MRSQVTVHRILRESTLGTGLGFSVLFEDPISMEIMSDAVITNCGHSFSKSTLDAWNKKETVRSPTSGKDNVLISCPLCNKKIKAKDCILI